MVFIVLINQIKTFANINIQIESNSRLLRKENMQSVCLLFPRVGQGARSERHKSNFTTP